MFSLGPQVLDRDLDVIKMGHFKFSAESQNSENGLKERWSRLNSVAAVLMLQLKYNKVMLVYIDGLILFH